MEGLVLQIHYCLSMTLDGDKWLFYSPALYTQRKTPQYLMSKKVGWPQSRSEESLTAGGIWSPNRASQVSYTQPNEI
jgi:hypothetical protein